MDKRKTKAEIEKRSVQECAIRVFKDLQQMTDKAGPNEDWTTRSIEFGEAMGDLIRLLEAVETGVEVENYPRAAYQASLEKHEQQGERDQGEAQETERGTRMIPDMPEGTQRKLHEDHRQGREETDEARRQHNR